MEHFRIGPPPFCRTQESTEYTVLTHSFKGYKFKVIQPDANLTHKTLFQFSVLRPNFQKLGREWPTFWGPNFKILVQEAPSPILKKSYLETLCAVHVLSQLTGTLGYTGLCMYLALLFTSDEAEWLGQVKQSTSWLSGFFQKEEDEGIFIFYFLVDAKHFKANCGHQLFSLKSPPTLCSYNL